MSDEDFYVEDQPLAEVKAIWDKAVAEGRTRNPVPPRGYNASVTVNLPSPAEAAVARVRALHAPPEEGKVCCRGCIEIWPCPTIRALEGAAPSAPGGGAKGMHSAPERGAEGTPPGTPGES